MTVISLQGAMGTWKSSMALSWRMRELKEAGLKKVVLDLELGVHRALRWFEPEFGYWDGDYPQGKWVSDWIEIWQPPSLTPEVMKDTLMFTKGDIIVGKAELYDTITTKYVELLGRDDVGSIVLDTAKVFWESNHLGVLQDMQAGFVPSSNNTRPRQSLQSIEYAKPNGRMNSFIGLASTMQKDLIMVNHERPIYIDAIVEGVLKSVPSPDGRMELDGYNKTMNLADWAFVTSLVPGSPDCIAKVLKSPIDTMMVGMPANPARYEAVQELVRTVEGLHANHAIR